MQSRDRKLAGFWSQLKIILWKNTILYFRNLTGLICEILLATVFIVIIALIISTTESNFNTKVPDYKQDQNVLNKINSNWATGTLFYYPANKLTDYLMTNTYKTIRGSQYRKYGISDLESTVHSSPNSLNASSYSKMYAFVAFPANISGMSEWPDLIEYTVYLKMIQNGLKGELSNKFVYNPKDMYRNSPEYFCKYGDNTQSIDDNFDGIKHAIDLNIIKLSTDLDIKESLDKVNSKKFVCPDFHNDYLKSTFSFLIPILISLCYLSTFIVNVSNIIVEKETKMREYLKLIGVKPTVIWICWVIRSIVVYLPISIVLTLILLVEYNNDPAGLQIYRRTFLEYTSPVLVFFVLFVYSIQTTLLSLLVGQIFSKTFMAKLFTIVFWFFTLVNFYGPLPTMLVYMLAAAPNYAINFLFQVIYQYERSSEHLTVSKTFRSLFHNVNEDEYFNASSLSLGGLMLSMIGWSIVYVILSWYIERINPGEFGVKLPLSFPFMPSYWLKRLAKPVEMAEQNHLLEDSDINDLHEEFFEKPSIKMKPTVQIKNMSKIFRSAFERKTAVDNLSLSFYEDQITGFLGHNGAGKTTVIFMLSGMYEPSSGTAYILDQDITTSMDSIRASIGFCPQHSILFDELTVRQHLELVALMKGFHNKDLIEEIERISSLLDLSNALNKYAKNLSGGMKRRLSLSMALIGDSKIIILDEPTSGLDPYNRRLVWELLREYKQGRTIILTTHFMDEADALSDRIAIMNHGQIKACGSTLFLKEKFGSGYKLTMTKGENFDKNKFSNMVQLSTGQPANYLSNMAQELCIGVKNSEVSKLTQLLNNIEIEKENIGILNYGVSTSTVEEVFIKIGNLDAKEENVNYDDFIMKSTESDGVLKLIFQKVKALIIKRFHILRRRYILLILTLFVPFIAEAFFNTSPISTANSFMSLLVEDKNPVTFYRSDISHYGHQKLPYRIVPSENVESKQFEEFSRFFRDYFNKKNGQNVILEEATANLTLIQFVKEKQANNVIDLIRNYYIGLEINLSKNKIIKSVDVFHNKLALHSTSAALNELNSFFLAYYTNNPNRKIMTINVPIPLSQKTSNDNEDAKEESYFNSLHCFEAVPFSVYDFINGLLVALLISLNTICIIREKHIGSKFLQNLSGGGSSVYWLANYIFDIAVYYIVIVIIVGILSLVVMTTNDKQSEAYLLLGSSPISTSKMFDLTVFLVISVYSWATCAYLWSYLFSSDVSGFVASFVIMASATFFDMIMVFIKKLHYNYKCDQFTEECLKTKIEIFSDVSRVLLVFFFPNIAVKRAFFGLKVRGLDCPEKFFYKETDQNSDHSIDLDFTEPGFYKYLLPLLVQFIVGNLIIYFIENRRRFFGLIHRSTRKNKNRLIVDSTEDDVSEESERIRSDLVSISEEESVVLSGLYKKFRNNKLKKFVAVKDLSFGVKNKECFGLLGLNGAGKTTTLKILLGELRASDGYAFINGSDVTAGNFNSNLGYCPQNDYLPDFMTVSEVLYLYANLRGLKNIKKVVGDFVYFFKLKEYEHKQVQNLSGGNKRKLSTAIAFIGGPKTVILDECTSGIDPMARRQIWNIIKKARDDGTTVILTNHSMEESEALCTKLGIMVNGQFECFGNPQHLKGKYGKGYSLIVKCKERQGITQSVETFIESNIPGAVLKERQQETLYYQIINPKKNDLNKGSGLSIGYIFNLFELNKVDINLETYSLCQTSLEQVFLFFASKQRKSDTDEDLIEKITREAPTDVIELDLISS